MTSSVDAEDQTLVVFGNRAAVEVVDDPDGEPGQKIRRPIVGAPKKNFTYFILEPGLSLAQGVTQLASVWPHHSDDPAPAWVASSDPRMSQLLGDHFSCEVRELDLEHEASGADDLVEG